MKSAWNFKRDILSMTVKGQVSLSIGNNRVCYSKCRIIGGRTLYFLGADGIFSIPNDDIRIWEIDCENKLLSASDYLVFSSQEILSKLDVVETSLSFKNFRFSSAMGTNMCTLE